MNDCSGASCASLVLCDTDIVGDGVSLNTHLCHSPDDQFPSLLWRLSRQLQTQPGGGGMAETWSVVV